MEKDEIWSKTLSLLLENTSEDDPKSVFLNLLTPLGIFGDQFVLLADSAAVESWVRNNYLTEMQEKILMVSDRPLTIGLSEKPKEDEPAAAQPKPQDTHSTPVTSEHPQASEPEWASQYPAAATPQAREPEVFIGADVQGHPKVPSSIAGDEALFMKCTFNHFVEGPSNKFARGAALAVAEQPGSIYNPLFIYGNSGLGKTHLLVSIANYVMQNFPHMKTQYVSANQFLNDYVEATRSAKWASFNSKYHNVDVLLVDDVQYLEGKDETINQLFNIFNEMTNRDKQIVLSADRAPKDIDLDDRMRSRFASGLTVDIKPPDYETRLAILKNYLTRVNQQTSFYGNIPDDVLGYLAEVATSNIREMEGAVTRVVSNMTLMKRDSITVEETQELIADFFPTDDGLKIDIDLIQSEVEKLFDITHEDMISSKRSKGITYPRHIAMYLSRYMTEESLESIGKKFGGRDHTTVMHSVRRIETDQKDNRMLFDQLEQLRLKIKERSKR